MTSIDDHPPPDPSSSDYQSHHPLQVSHNLKINSDEKAPASVSDIDLLKFTDADLGDTNNPLHSFSIRDYVCGSRSKDITCNWPFSRGSLQLCLHWGLKNLLPPFQSLDLLRGNSSGNRCAVENGLPNEETINSFDEKSTDDRLVSITYSNSESQSHLEEGLAHRKSKSSHLASSQKTVNTTIPATIKKCKSLMNLNSGVESVEEVSPNNLIVSETMASKVCPVCKTFLSSSNTTLNAHIDQCLSWGSSVKWAGNPKVMVKHRIKTRKTRLVVDIYETARHCSVEDLDRRSSTSWATNSKFPDQELECQGEEKEEQRGPTFIPEVADHEGAVYIDTNGTKLRILSMPKVSTLDDHEARKLQKRGKGSKIVTEKKKNKPYGEKHHGQFLKLSPNSKKICSLKPHHGASKARSGQEENLAIGESCNKEDQGKKPMKAQVHMYMDNLAITRPPWACSKRTGLAKKFSGKDGMLHSGPGANKRFPMLAKPKEATLLHDSFEDPPSKFSSLKKNLSSASRECIPGSKSNLKRKFSALKKSRDHCSSMENAVGGSFQDCSKQISRMEEDRSKKLSFEIVNLLEVKQKKSVTSNGSNGDSSVGRETAFVDPLLDLEYASTEVRSHCKQVSNVAAPRRTDVEGSSMGLRKPLDDESLKLVCQLNNKFDLQECVELYQGRLCSRKRNLDDIDNIEAHMDDTEKQGSCFPEVDPIPIPGPPGTFSPSPGGDMVSEELQGNSSLTTKSRVQSSEDQRHHDLMNKGYMSNSPVSTISNPSLARSDSRSWDKLSARFTSLQDTRLDYTGVMVDAVDEKSAPITSSPIAIDWRSVDAIFTEKGPIPIGFQNDQPCRCSRKEGAFSQNVASNYQESAAVLRKRSLESNRRPSSTNFRSKLFSQINRPSLPSLPPPPPPPEAVKSSADASVKVPIYRDCESAVSPSKPVLRLMGKNLTVVTSDDVSSSQQFRPPCSSPMGHQQLQNIQNNDFNSFFHGYPSQHPVIFSQNPNGSKPQHFNVHPPNNSRSHADFRPVHASHVHTMFPSTISDLVAPADCYRLDAKKAHDSNVDNAPSKATKEIIIIDDSSENETDDHILNKRMRKNQASSSSSILMHQSHSSVHPYGGGVSPVFCNGSFQTWSSLREVVNNKNLGRWDSAQSGFSNMSHPSSLGLPSHMRSSTACYPRSFS